MYTSIIGQKAYRVGGYMKFKGYILTVIMAGLALGPVGVRADEAIVTVPSLTDTQKSETQNAQQSESKESRSHSHQNITIPESMRPIALLSIFAGIAGLVYLHNRSIVLAHEGGHALAAWIVGNKLKYFHVDTAFMGGGCLDYVYKTTGLKRAFQSLGGPLGGVAAYFGWEKLFESGQRKLCGDKESGLFTKLIVRTLALYGSFTHLTDNLIPKAVVTLDQSYGPMAGLRAITDGTSIQENLAIVSPILGAAYPSIAWAGIAAFTGYSVYRIYQVWKDLQKEIA